LRKLVADLLRFLARHFADFGIGLAVLDHAVKNLELSTQPPHLSRRSRNRLDLGIIL
jgi:hypothetical protein